MTNMGRVLLLAVCLLVNLGAGLRLPSSADMLESLEQRIGVRISNMESEIETRISNTESEIESRIANMEDEIKLETKQLRKEVLLIYDSLIDFEENIKLMLSDQKAGKQDVEQIEDKTNDDDKQNEEKFKRIDTRISEIETGLKKEKEFKQDIMDAVKTVTTAVSLMSDGIGEIRDGINSVRGGETKMAEIKKNLESMQRNFDASQRNINTTLESVKQTTAELRYNITDALFDQDSEWNEKCSNQLNLSEKRLEMKIDNTQVLVQNLTVQTTDNFAEMIEATKQVQNQCKEREDVEQTTPESTVHSSCRDGITTSGVYRIKLPGIRIFDAYCDMKTEGGGWMVFQRRQDGSVDFYRTWQEYKNGFGNVSGEFWLGNDIIHNLTSTASYELRIDLLDWDGSTAYAKYDNFNIGPESDKYRLHVSGYSGTAGDSITIGHAVNNQQFSTKDQDNDRERSGSCAVKTKGAWWYKQCTESNLNGHYYPQAKFTGDQRAGLCWYQWGKRWNYSLKGSEMKIRPK